MRGNADKTPLLIPALLLLLCLLAAASASASSPVVGDWLGTLDVPGAKLRLLLHIVEGENGLSATLDSPDQGVKDIPGGEVSFSERQLKVTIPAVGGLYSGTLDEEGILRGTWSQAGQSMALDLEPAGEIEAPKRPQEPKPPFPYREEEVAIDNAEGGVTLAGSLTLPKGQGPHPAVVLISGSGPQNRNEELLGHKPFLVLADALTRGGIAVLRYDDRGVGDSTGSFATATSMDFASDTEAIVAFLEAREDIREIGLIGHSEGGLIAPIVANASEDVDFLVLLAGPGLRGDEVLVTQSDRMFELQGIAQGIRDQNSRLQRRAYALLDENDTDGLRSTLTKMFALQAPRLNGKDLEAQLDAQMSQLTGPWFRFFTQYDPKPALAKVSQPILALNGAKDVQVLAEPNLAAIRAAASGNPHLTTLALPGLNHLFQTAEIGAVAEYAQIEETFAPSALKIILDWTLEQVASEAP